MRATPSVCLWHVAPRGGPKLHPPLKHGSLAPSGGQAILEDLQPEAAYFAAVGGNRGGYLIVNMRPPRM